MRAVAGLVLFSTLALGGNCRLGLSPSDSVSRLVAPGQTVRVQNLRVEFLEVVADSRCPANVSCPVAGDAIVAFALRVDAATAEVELHVVDPVRRSLRFQDYIVELTALAPYPVAGQPIDHDSYRATINVRRD